MDMIDQTSMRTLCSYCCVMCLVNITLSLYKANLIIYTFQFCALVECRLPIYIMSEVHKLCSILSSSEKVLFKTS